MVKILAEAIAEVADLPEDDQEQIGRRLLSHVEKLRGLRADIDKGTRSLGAGLGGPLDVEEFIRRKNEYQATAEELQAIDEADRSGVATEEEVEAAFRTFRSR